MDELEDLRRENSALRGEVERLRAQAAAALRDLEEAQAIGRFGHWSSAIEPDSPFHWSRECCRIFGVPEGTQLTVQGLLDRIPESDRALVRQKSREAVELGVPFDLEHRVIRPDGRPCWVHARAHIERDERGVARKVGTMQDITERRLALEKLLASEERYRRIVDNTSDGVWAYDADGNTTLMNRRMAEMLGYTVDEVIGRSVYSFIAKENLAAARERTARREAGIAERTDVWLQRKDGTELWGSAQSNPFFGEDGRYEGGVALVTDVTEDRHADQARAVLAAIVESSEDAIFHVNMDGKIASWNLSAERLYLYPAAEAVGQPVAMLIPPELRAEQRAVHDRVFHGEPAPQYETKQLRKDGSLVEVAVTISPVRNASRDVIGISKICRDLTAQREAEAAHRRTEEQFRQVQKMEAVGRLAGGIAHDFNNLLTVILSYSDIALHELQPRDPLREELQEIHAAAFRASELTKQLLAFSRQQVLQPRALDLNRILASMQRMVARIVGEDIELVVRPAADLGHVLADPGQLEQVVLNLVINARDAMPEGGKLLLETANLEQAEEQGGLAKGRYVQLCVSDTGVGMDEATRARIFEPFFTTKDRGKGTGLGLATVFGIVKQSGGQITVASEPGAGSAFTIYLPRTDRPLDSSDASPRSLGRRGAETILLVEDEPQVRAVACAILRRQGYTVLEASSGAEAFVVSREHAGDIHLLLTDVVMPRMSGRKLAEGLAPRWPGMKVLFASGYTDDAILRHGVRDDGVAFLQKPFTPEVLVRRVREVLDG